MLLSVLAAVAAFLPRFVAVRDVRELSSAAVSVHDYGDGGGLGAQDVEEGPFEPKACQEVIGATNRNSEQFPLCKCSASNHYVVCGEAKVGDRRFNALDVFNASGCQKPQCAAKATSCARIQGAVVRMSGAFPDCKCSSYDKTVFCRGKSVAGRKFDARVVLAKAECRRPRCARKKTCDHISGATGRESKAYPLCKCKAWYQEVYSGGSKVADRKFDADEVLDRYNTPYCFGTEETLIRARIGHCIKPGVRNFGTSNEHWHQEVTSKILTLSDGAASMDVWRQNPFGSTLLPPHLIAGLVRDDDKYGADRPVYSSSMDSKCFQFDYDDDSAPDPSGCRLFKDSFKPLKDLRTCIVEELNKDEKWTNRFQLEVEEHGFTDFKGPYEEWCRQSVWTKTLGISVKLCHLGIYFDTLQRAEEMMKFTLFKGKIKPQDLGKILPEDFTWDYLQRKIQMTLTWPRGQKSLTDETAKTISAKCYKVEEVEDGNGQPQHSHFSKLQNIGVCQPLMYDKVDIAGLGLSDAGAKWSSPDFFKEHDDKGLALWSTKQIPSVCGRMALATIFPFQTAKYSVLTVSTWANDKYPTWQGCADVKSSNCRKFYFCWKEALDKVCEYVSNDCCLPNKAGE